jgi:hypothetical protein
MSVVGALCGKRRQRRCASLGANRPNSAFVALDRRLRAPFRPRLRRFVVAQADQRRDVGLEIAGYLANVG